VIRAAVKSASRSAESATASAVTNPTTGRFGHHPVMATEPDGRVLDGLGDDVPIGGDGDADLGFDEVKGGVRIAARIGVGAGPSDLRFA
jgi:hypothetical protein